MPQRREVGHGVGSDEVAAAQRGGIETQLVRRLVDQALQQIDILGPARAAIGVRRRRVGVGGAHADVQRRRPVGADQRAGAAHGGDGGARSWRHRRRGWRRSRWPMREKPPVGVQRERRPRAEVPALVVARHGLAPLRHPLDRAPEPARREEHQRVLGIDPELDSKGAAHIRRHHAHPLRRHPQHVLGQDVPHKVDALRARRQRVGAAAGIVGAERGPRLHGADDDPLVAGLQADPVGRSSQRLLHRSPLAQLPVHAEIAGCLVVQQRRLGLQRGLPIGHRRKRPIGDGNRLGRGAGFLGALGDDEGDRVAHDPRPPRREHRAGRRRALAAIRPLGLHHAGNRADPGLVEVSGGIDRQHPRQRRRSARIDGAQLGMGVGRAHHRAPGLARQREVVEIAPAAGEEAFVLPPPRRPADTVRHPAPALPCARRQVR